MQRKIVILVMALVVAFVFCGAASAAPIKNNQISTAKINNVGTAIHKPDLIPTSIKVSYAKGIIMLFLELKIKGQ